MSMVLTKENAGIGDPADLPGITKFRVGVSWDASTRGKGGVLGKLSRRNGVDLDLVAIAVDTAGRPVRMAGLDNNDPLKDGSLVHSGDNTTGKGEGDDETVDVDLTRLPSNIQAVVFAVAVFKENGMAKAMKDKGFQGADNVEFSLYDVSDGTPGKLAPIWPSLMGSENCCLVAKLVRDAAGWKLAVLEKMVRITTGDRDSLLRTALSA